ncbi:ATP-binding cassette domain-containing protein [Streptomyces sp. NPDC056061]|uniref:ATP-binding cassette domain-containing protein n=1 Tax=Streptomyces sp. NPDC056061 TaxID=3345700 RepID=UPI0035DD348E
MLQVIGLTSAPRRGRPVAVDDLTFDAPSGHVTALLGATGSGKTAALRLMLELDSGRGVTYFRGRPLHRIPNPAREVGVLLGDVPGHPARTVRGQLRMLCAAAGVSASRADELLETVGLGGLRDQRIGTLSPGMDRMLAFASALLGDPHTLVLDDPADGLSPREEQRVRGLMKDRAAQGGTVLCTTTDPREAVRIADRVVTIDGGRLVADQSVGDFSRTRLRARVAVRSPHAARLASVVSREARAARRSVEVVAEAGGRLSVHGATCAEIGDTAFRHSLPVHRLTDEVVDAGHTGSCGEVAGTGPVDPGAEPAVGRSAGRGAGPTGRATGAPATLSIRRRPPRGPFHPLRYELRRLLGVRTTPLVASFVMAVSVALSLLLARSDYTQLPRALAAWPSLLPLPPAAMGAGLLGALSFGDEFRYPALATGRGTVPRRLGLLLAKLVVSAGAALVLGVTAVLASAATLHLVHGGDLMRIPTDFLFLGASWAGLTVGSAWAGLLGAGVFRMASAGVAAVLAVPVLVVPLVRAASAGVEPRAVAGLPDRLRRLVWPHWPHEADRWLAGALRVVAHPVGTALSLSLSVLVCAYAFTSLRGRVRW